MLKQVFAVTVALLLLAATANANVIDVHWECQDGDPDVADSVQNTLLTSMTGDWTNAVILIDLTAGELLNPVSPPPPFNDNRNSGSNENDTWVDSPNEMYGYPTIVEFDIDGDVDEPLYDTYEGYVDWFDTVDNGPCTDGVAARLYVSDDAMGAWLVRMYDVDSAGVPTVVTGQINAGSFCSVPEPAAMTLLALGGVFALANLRRRRG